MGLKDKQGSWKDSSLNSTHSVKASRRFLQAQDQALGALGLGITRDRDLEILGPSESAKTAKIGFLKYGGVVGLCVCVCVCVCVF